MKVRLLYALVAVLCTAFALRASEPPPVRDVVPAHGPTDVSVYVSVDLGGGSSAGGTGTIIASEGGKSLVLTAAHVVPDGERPVSVTYCYGGRYYVTPVTYLGGSRVSNDGPSLIRVHGPDLALLQLDYAMPTAELADAIPAAGEPVFLYGFGGTDGVVPQRKAGSMLSEDGYRTMAGDPIARTSIATVNGDSGAGVFDGSGRLVAVHWGGGSVRLDTVHSFTVQVLERRGIFQRFKDRLAARKIAKAVAKVLPAATPAPALPPAVKEPAAKPAEKPAAKSSWHWEQRCTTDRFGRKKCYLVRVSD